MNSIYRQLNKKANKEKILALQSRYDKVDRRLLDTAQTVTQYFAGIDIPLPNHIVNRARFLSAKDELRDMTLRHLIGEKRNYTPVKQRKWMWQFAATVIVLTLMLFPLRGQMTVAAKDSLPGDALYLLKLATEDSAVEFIEEPEVKALMILSFADKRIDEISTLAQEGREIPLPAIYRTHRLLNTALSYAAWASDEDMIIVLEEMNQHIQSYVHVLEHAKMGLVEENDVRITDMEGRCLRLQLIVTAASLEPDVFRDAYRAGTPEQMTALSDPLGSDPTLAE